ncbi:major facilitator superfamily domain-containing protein [Tricharina praecox]|uniref:major facilitator superfamily domain-containing protein n=1 Tax=Tricharina praecox TaxID=43433 RepID=UPI0022200A33|nr:major facilitator superfamily domain-containing protein [Tricharina praecox]KAI5843277.1 major facilitator superfamily domain-containing protein [Tricharina praecox]
MARTREQQLHAARVVSLVASMAISLAAGTNYAYSAYAPQLAERLALSATESNLIGTFGNLGMYLSGIPSGMLVDNKGPRPPMLIGAVCLFLGYFPIHLAMLNGEGYMSIPALCFFSTLTGVGSCCAFGGALKMAALNWPGHRGTATALPLAAFGLSAFFFSCLSSWLFPGNTDSFLLMLAIATSGIVVVAFFFCRIVPVPGSYAAVPSHDPEAAASRLHLHRTKSGESGHSGRYADDDSLGTAQDHPQLPALIVIPNPDPIPDEESSLFSKSTSSSTSSDENIRDAESIRSTRDAHSDSGVGVAHHVDIRGWALVRSSEFWLIFTMLGALTGVGLMTINNIGHNAQALWNVYDPSKGADFVQARQSLHVSIISIGSCTGRILSGISSDVLIRKFGTQRLWLIIFSSLLFFIAQLAALNISNPVHLWAVSTLTGLGYGFLFGVMPTIVSEAFGVHGLSTNWGTMTIAAVISGNTLNLFYGKVFDDHSVRDDQGRRWCSSGLECYRNAYWISTLVVILGFAVTVVGLLRHRGRGKA